jgi:hypothetical protein
MNPDTLTRIRAEAVSYARRTIADENLADIDAVRDLLRDAFLRGADAGYTARCAEERQP